MIQNYGEDATVLFSLFEFNENGRKYLNQKLQNHSDLLCSNFIVTNHIHRLIDNDNEHYKQKSNFEEKIVSLKKEIKQDNKKQNISYKRKIKSLEKKINKKYQEQKRDFHNKIYSLENQFEQKYQEQNSYFQNIINSLDGLQQTQASALTGSSQTEEMSGVVFVHLQRGDTISINNKMLGVEEDDDEDDEDDEDDK